MMDAIAAEIDAETNRFTDHMIRCCRDYLDSNPRTKDFEPDFKTAVAFSIMLRVTHHFDPVRHALEVEAGDTAKLNRIARARIDLQGWEHMAEEIDELADGLEDEIIANETTRRSVE
jgi:hypothetical protein